ncbi:hypothetical protein MMPV_001493 [Pyropia vietnamensis]
MAAREEPAIAAPPGEDGEATWTPHTSGGSDASSSRDSAAVAAPPLAPTRWRPDSPDWRRLNAPPALSDSSLLDEVLAWVLRVPAAAAWLFDRRPVGSLSAAAITFLRDAPCYQDVVLPLMAGDLSLGAVSKGAVLGEEPSEMAGNQLMYMPCVVFDGLVFGTFFGDNKPPVPGPVPDPTSSRWVLDIQSGATVLFTWFPDDRVAVTSSLCTRFGEWAYELDFYYGVAEGTLPAKRAMSASFRTLRHCFYCSARRVSCECSPAIRQRALVDMEHEQPLDFTSASDQRESDANFFRRWAAGHEMRRAGNFSSEAALTYYSDKTIPVTHTKISLFWTVGRLSPRRAANLRAGLAAQLHPARPRTMTPSTPPIRERSAARPPRVAAISDVCGTDAETGPDPTPIGRTKRRVAASEVPPVRPAGAHVDANGVRRRRRRRGGHHALYYEAAVLGGIAALGDGYVRRGVPTETVTTNAEPLLAPRAHLSGSSSSSRRSEQSDTDFTAVTRRAPPVERAETQTPSSASASQPLPAACRGASPTIAALRDPVSDNSESHGGAASTVTIGDNDRGACISGAGSSGDDRALTPGASATPSDVAHAGASTFTQAVVSDITQEGTPSSLLAPLLTLEPSEGVPDTAEVALAEDDPFTYLPAISTDRRDGVTAGGCWEDLLVSALWRERSEEVDGSGEVGGTQDEPATSFSDR